MTQRSDQLLRLIRQAPSDYEDCCEFSYICPSSGEEECLRHGGFDNCCDHPKCPGNRECNN